MAGKHIQDRKTGRMRGSIGAGKDRVPTAADQRTRTEVAAQQVEKTISIAEMHARMQEMLPADSESTSPYQAFKDAFTDPAATSSDRHRLLVSQQHALVEHFVDHPEDQEDLANWVNEAGFGVIQSNTRTLLGPIGRRVEKERNAREDAEEDRLREERAELKRQRAAATRERRSRKGADPSLMTGTDNLLFERSCASHPQLVAEWDPENPCTPDKITLASNQAAWFRCPRCQYRWKSTVDNRTKGYLKNGGNLRINCENCQGRKKRSMERTQTCLAEFQQHLNGNSEAFDALPPALQHALLVQSGAITSNEDAFGSALALGIARGDYTLSEVVAATDVDDFVQGINEDRQDDTALRDVDITHIDQSTETVRTTSPTENVDLILTASSLAGAIDNDILANRIVRTSVESLWNQTHDAPNEVPSILNQLRDAAESDDPYQARVAREFLEEYEAVSRQPLPDGYSVQQVRNGRAVEMEPLMSQRRFAYLVEQERVVGNWSGTGAGKTLSAAMASRSIDAQETIIFCPKGVKPQWVTEFESSFPGVYDIRDGLPNLDENLDDSSGKPRVWVVNYDALSQDHRAKAARLDMLSDRVDMIVYDEAHLVKKSVPTGGSIRRGVLESFTDRSRANRPDVAIVMQTATPVKNNLEEAKSLLRILNGPDDMSIRGIRTEPTPRNASTIYTHISEAGIRWKPAYEQKLTRNEITVDITPHTRRVAARVNTGNGTGGTVTPAAMERALLAEKLPAITERVRAANGPVVIYSQYVDGMVDPIAEHLTSEGYRVKTYTGSASAQERTQMMRDFQSGNIDVLVGSSPIATGIDGLQNTSNHMIVVSMPWTAADDDQLVGRMQRPGQTRNVTVDYILAEAKAGDVTWSYDRNNRLNRVKFKRGLADAVVDGILPEGTLHEQHDVSGALESLVSLLESQLPTPEGAGLK